MTTFKIIRMFFNDDVPNRIIKRGLTQEQAQAHCSDPETSSSTCTNRAGLERTRKHGPWFDGWTEDDR